MSRHNSTTGQLILKLLLALFCMLCLLPTCLVVVASFTDESTLTMHGFHLFPKKYSLDGYRYIFTFSGQILESYKITLFSVICGTATYLLVTSMAAYAISRSEYVLKPYISFFFLISMLISGGLLATYLTMTNIWHMRNNLLIFILPGAFSSMNCFIMRSFIQSNVPAALVESARIDGAGEFKTYVRIVLPIMQPSLAALGFMGVVGRWNDWGTGFLYINESRLMPLQLLLMKIENQLSFLETNVDTLTPDQVEMLLTTPRQSGRMALLISVILPIMVVYPFFQKYFIKGITLGSLKG